VGGEGGGVAWHEGVGLPGRGGGGAGGGGGGSGGAAGGGLPWGQLKWAEDNLKWAETRCVKKKKKTLGVSLVCRTTPNKLT